MSIGLEQEDALLAVYIKVVRQLIQPVNILLATAKELLLLSIVLKDGIPVFSQDGIGVSILQRGFASYQLQNKAIINETEKAALIAMFPLALHRLIVNINKPIFDEPEKRKASIIVQKILALIVQCPDVFSACVESYASRFRLTLQGIETQFIFQNKFNALLIGQREGSHDLLFDAIFESWSAQVSIWQEAYQNLMTPPKKSFFTRVPKPSEEKLTALYREVNDEVYLFDRLRRIGLDMSDERYFELQQRVGNLKRDLMVSLKLQPDVVPLQAVVFGNY